MWNLDDQTKYKKVLEVNLPWATTWGQTGKYAEERERIRQLAAPLLTNRPDSVEKWAFRITVGKAGRRQFDIENVVKPIVDAFCERQIKADRSQYENLGLYPDDTPDHVVLLEIAGSRIVGQETTRVEIFAVRNPERES